MAKACIEPYQIDKSAEDKAKLSTSFTLRQITYCHYSAENREKSCRSTKGSCKTFLLQFFFFLDKIVSGQKILKALSSSYWGYPRGYIRVGKGYVLPVSRLFCLIIDPFFSFLLLPSPLLPPKKCNNCLKLRKSSNTKENANESIKVEKRRVRQLNI